MMTSNDLDSARLTIRLGAVSENFRTCADLAIPAHVAGVVKADAYGLGAEPVARALFDAGCDTFFVARLAEGMALRPVLPRARIFVLDGVMADTVSSFRTWHLIPVLNSLAQLAAWSAAARTTRAKFDAALHIDTGMNRLGMPRDEFAMLTAQTSARLQDINLTLIMSHLACAEDPGSAMNAQQLARFRSALAGLPPAPASLSSSAGIMLGKAYAFDMVRPGIALYGGNPQPKLPNPFKVVVQLTGRILQVHRVDKGESVGYGATFRAGRPTTLATVALGYADGLMRAIGNRGAGAINGICAPIAGRVSMDLITLDVTDIPQGSVDVGADVEFLGDTISLESLAAAANSASYEILTSLRGRVSRRYVEAA